ncbi:hypothetical protein NKH53_29015 [Mesorhizobium australicum]|uniref:hypothetical protein n=1 Tax=Mesorhizobium australicum TaxID=536018 RepID=UPI0033387E32
MSRLQDALESRDVALRAFKTYGGTWERIGDLNVLKLGIGDLDLIYQTPFQKLPEPSDSDKYMLAQVGRTTPNLSYGLDIWVNRKKVMNLEWADDGQVYLVSFKDGPWRQILAGV